MVDKKGTYRSSGVGGGITGMGGEYIIIDDPVKNREDADSATMREKVYDWYTSTLYTRLEKDGCILLTLTRWHEDDLAGEAAQSSAGGCRPVDNTGIASRLRIPAQTLRGAAGRGSTSGSGNTMRKPSKR